MLINQSVFVWVHQSFLPPNKWHRELINGIENFLYALAMKSYKIGYSFNATRDRGKVVRVARISDAGSGAFFEFQRSNLRERAPEEGPKGVPLKVASVHLWHSRKPLFLPQEFVFLSGPSLLSGRESNGLCTGLRCKSDESAARIKALFHVKHPKGILTIQRPMVEEINRIPFKGLRQSAPPVPVDKRLNGSTCYPVERASLVITQVPASKWCIGCPLRNRVFQWHKISRDDAHGSKAARIPGVLPPQLLRWTRPVMGIRKSRIDKTWAQASIRQRLQDAGFNAIQCGQYFFASFPLRWIVR